MLNKKLLYLSALVLVFMILQMDVDAQCAMCKATAESSLKENEGQAGNGINKGILYIMFVPYTLLMLLVGIFFRKNVSGFFRNIGLIK